MLVVEHCEKEGIGVGLQKVLVQLCALIPPQRMRQPSPHLSRPMRRGVSSSELEGRLDPSKTERERSILPTDHPRP